MATPKTPQAEAYEALLAEFARAVEMMHQRRFSEAEQLFGKLQQDHREEPELAERARTYSRICAVRAAPPAAEPQDARERFHLAVALTNERRLDEAIALLDRLITETTDPHAAVDCLFTRSSAWALKGDVDHAVQDLRQAIAADPRVRFQAANDPDFEKIREEPAFIDIIEPTPTEA